MLKIEKMLLNDKEESLDVFRKSYKNIGAPNNEEECFLNDFIKSHTDEHHNSLEFYKIVHNKSIISFGGIEALPATDGAWMLRWGTTLPNAQNQGLMTSLTKFRLKIACERTKGFAGNVQIMSRSPSLYRKLGFKEIYTRGPKNKATFMIKVINKEFDLLSQNKHRLSN